MRLNSYLNHLNNNSKYLQWEFKEYDYYLDQILKIDVVAREVAGVV